MRLENEDIPLSHKTVLELFKLGNMDSSFDDVIWDLVTHAKTCDRWCCDHG